MAVFTVGGDPKIPLSRDANPDGPLCLRGWRGVAPSASTAGCDESLPTGLLAQSQHTLPKW